MQFVNQKLLVVLLYRFILQTLSFTRRVGQHWDAAQKRLDARRKKLYTEQERLDAEERRERTSAQKKHMISNKKRKEELNKKD
jgi:hypothetical protein